MTIVTRSHVGLAAVVSILLSMRPHLRRMSPTACSTSKAAPGRSAEAGGRNDSNGPSPKLGSTPSAAILLS